MKKPPDDQRFQRSYGGAYGIRTRDLIAASDARFQLR